MLNGMWAPVVQSWQWRHFIVSSIRNDLKVRFSRSVLGGLWMLLNPLAMVLMYTVILSAVLSAKLPGIDNRFAYAIYLISGMLGWTLFLEIVQRCISVFIEHANQIKKINFPKITLPIIVTGTSLIGYLTLLIVTLIAFACLSHLYWQGWLWIPVLTVITTFLAVGFGLILGVINVFVRDLGQLMNIVLQLLFWFTPIVYPAHIVPESLQYLQKLNPLYHIVESYHQVLAYNQAPSIGALSAIFALSCLLLWMAMRVYRKASSEMMDVL
ncbi:Teichoic acid translocation permease protein TagG [Marinomonas gallaica]|uniref:Transport permease protein n=1 Tax=Marinomonas gallaica TaxID=1806667 RepID=A0A1C3JV16_9GAMM|nr:ABC transporter permease [Marinomonas gallaica]SBT18962.1 Teichoic acid translocation permease protein TagG [Marinomonas gallaica]SBT21917.1 Teichoic acid translocation permease protein TagG [Marinomonas gallaica]